MRQKISSLFFKSPYPLLLSLLFLLTFQANADCRLSLFIDEEYRQLVTIAAQNKARRETLMNSRREQRAELAHEHLFAALRYEEAKSRLYIAMLDIILQRDNGHYQKSAQEIKRRLKKSFLSYESFSFALREIEGFIAVPIKAPMSERVAHFFEE